MGRDVTILILTYAALPIGIAAGVVAAICKGE
jgi:hypothetical protein